MFDIEDEIWTQLLWCIGNLSCQHCKLEHLCDIMVSSPENYLHAGLWSDDYLQ